MSSSVGIVFATYLKQEWSSPVLKTPCLHWAHRPGLAGVTTSRRYTMLNITVETHPNILSAAVVLGDNLYSEALHAEDNKDLCRRFIQKIFNEGELSLLGDFMSPHVVNHELADAVGKGDGPPEGRNLQWMADLVHLYRHAFPDLRCEIQDQIAEGDRVVTCIRMQGTQKN